VKKLIRNKHTRAFLKDGNWAKDCEGATEFQNAEAARRATVAFNLKGVELYYLVGDTPSAEWDLTLHLPDSPNNITTPSASAASLRVTSPLSNIERNPPPHPHPRLP
jgi:hypothetical protein